MSAPLVSVCLVYCWAEDALYLIGEHDGIGWPLYRSKYLGHVLTCETFIELDVFLLKEDPCGPLQ